MTMTASRLDSESWYWPLLAVCQIFYDTSVVCTFLKDGYSNQWVSILVNNGTVDILLCHNILFGQHLAVSL